MNTCKDCKHWGHIWPDDLGRAQCSRMEFAYSDDHYSATNPRPSGECVTVEFSDDQGLDVSFVTPPDFGCVRFEQKT